jgi:Ni/Co efflux regulator RcnB
MRLIASSLMAGLIAVTAAAPAFADQRGRGHDRGRDYNDRDYRHGYKDGRRDEWRDDRRDDRRDRRDDRRDRRGWYDSRGSHHHWKRGDYFHSRPHYSNYVVVNDYHRYRLPPPRYGQHYYRDHDTGEILLIAAATGLVMWALTN